MNRIVFNVFAAIALLASTALVSNRAEAAAMPSATGLRVAIDSMSLTEQAQFLYLGREYCWYWDGWSGPGWYWCGYNLMPGVGWGGGRGFRRWGVPARSGPTIVIAPRVVAPRVVTPLVVVPKGSTGGGGGKGKKK